MAKLLRLRRGTTTQHSTFTGAEGEVTIDTTKDTLVVHDNATAGGRPLLREDVSNLGTGAITSTHIADGTIVDADINASAAIAKTKISGTAITAADTGTVTSTLIADGTIVDGDINASAGIAHTKLAGITAGSVLMGNASAVPTATALTGDVTISSSGVTAISAGAVVTADIADGAVTSAKIADGAVTSAKIADGTIANADINSAAAIDKTKISGTAITAADTGTVTNTMLAGSIAANKVSGTAVTQADTGTVTNAMLAGSIAASKISGTAVTQADSGTVTSTMIANGTIVDADINASAAIAKTKISGTAITASDSGTVNSTILANASVIRSKIGYAGAILQVAQTVDTTIASYDPGNSYTDLGSMSVSIAPTSSSSKVLVMVDLQTSGPGAGGGFLLVRDGTGIYTGSGAGGREQFTKWTYGWTDTGQYYGCNSTVFTFLDSPGTTSTVTYKIRYRCPYGTGYAVYLNRTVYDSAGYYASTASSITAMEVSG